MNWIIGIGAALAAAALLRRGQRVPGGTGREWSLRMGRHEVGIRWITWTGVD